MDPSDAIRCRVLHAGRVELIDPAGCSHGGLGFTDAAAPALVRWPARGPDPAGHARVEQGAPPDRPP